MNNTDNEKFMKVGEKLSNLVGSIDMKNLINPSDLFIKPIDYGIVFPTPEIPEVTPLGDMLDTITQRQDKQIEKQNEVIENQNQQIIELQNISLKKYDEIKQLKDLNMKKSAEFYEMEQSAKKERIKWWVTTGIAVTGLLVAIASMIIAIVK